MKTSKMLKIGVLVCLAIAGNASALQFNLAQLIQGEQSVMLGDKVFSDWNFGATAIRGENPLSAIGVNVEITNPDNGPDYYLKFAGGFFAEYDEVYDYQLYYSVATANGARSIRAIDQAFNLTSGGTGGTVGIAETVYDGGFFEGKVVAQSSVGFMAGVADYRDPEGESLQGDQLNISPALAKVWVTKDLYLHAKPDGAVGATIFVQSFHQTVPDGGTTLAMLGLAMAGIGLLRRFVRG